tara:strand:- start:4561 stop:4935 length:375 start_codon:yes stop_codon:yes gene_type:complete
MGRYYHGDIEGKFWFAVQSSNAADRFGCTGHNNYISYYFDEGDLPEIRREIQNIEEKLGKHLNVFEEFFSMTNGYNDKTLSEYFKKHKLEYNKDLLEEYADLGLGKQILECVEEYGTCGFEAEI